jgi:hypothetical protein
VAGDGGSFVRTQTGVLMRFKFLLVTSIFMLCAFVLAQQPSNVVKSLTVKTGIIAGVVMDPTEARIPRSEIEVVDENGKSYRTIADSAGEFRMEVPAAVYVLKVSGIRGFVPFERPKFHLIPGTKLTFPIRLEVAVLGCLPIGDLIAIGEIVEPEPACNSVRQILATDEDRMQQLVVEYWSRTGTGAQREFSQATAYCDVYAVRADKLIYDSGTHELLAKDNAIVEDGNSIREVKSLAIKFPECSPVIVD